MIYNGEEFYTSKRYDINPIIDRVQDEVDELLDEVDRIADTTQFNGKGLLDGSASRTVMTNKIGRAHV